MINNSLIIPILHILKNHKAEISEYELIQKLEESGFDFPQDSSNELTLFKKHFLVMNALYKLKNELINDGYFLTVTSLSIKIDEIKEQSSKTDPIDYTDLKLSEYYLDWSNYENTTQQDVSDLLNGFWKKFFAVDKKAEALRVLGLESDASLIQIKQTYQRLVAKNHPDKGGSHKGFIEIREAYEILKFCF